MVTRLRGTDIFGVLDSLGDNQHETIEQWLLRGVEFSLESSPLMQYLEKCFENSGVKVSMVCFENPSSPGPYNAVRVIDDMGHMTIDLVVRIPSHVTLAVDFWPDLIDNDLYEAIFDTPRESPALKLHEAF